jgi:hypothetical protein
MIRLRQLLCVAAFGAAATLAQSAPAVGAGATHAEFDIVGAVSLVRMRRSPSNPAGSLRCCARERRVRATRCSP